MLLSWSSFYIALLHTFHLLLMYYLAVTVSCNINCVTSMFTWL